MPVTLEQLLQSRDNRAKHQKDLLESHPGRSLLCMTVQLPGPEKRNEISLAIAKAGVKAVRDAFEPEYEELRDLETGYEAYFLVPLSGEDAKRTACHIEDNHPLGRLMDLDVVVGHDDRVMPGSTGYLHPISRESLGLKPRKCLLCDNEVRYCMRAKNHSKEELLSRIEQMLKEYELQAPNPRTD
jgi:holo-ACP synthase CitX